MVDNASAISWRSIGGRACEVKPSDASGKLSKGSQLLKQAGSAPPITTELLQTLLADAQATLQKEKLTLRTLAGQTETLETLIAGMSEPGFAAAFAAPAGKAGKGSAAASSGKAGEELRRAVAFSTEELARLAGSLPTSQLVRFRTRLNEAEARLVRSLLDVTEVRNVLLAEIEDDDIAESGIVEIVRAVSRLVENGENVTYPRIGAEISDDARAVLTRIAAMSYPAPNIEDGRSCLVELRARRFQAQMSEIQKRLEAEKDVAETDELLRRKVQLKKRIEALRQASA